MTDKILLNSKNFEISEFSIPGFQLNSGEMVRFWVEIVPRSENGVNGYWGIEEVKKTIQELSSEGEAIHICSEKIKTSLLDVLNPISTGGYMMKTFELTSSQTQELLSRFEINVNWKVRNLGRSHQKVFSIICGFLKESVIAFDYYGLSPNTEEQLSKYVLTELVKGKSAISFDNIQFISEMTDSERITNLEIMRK